MSTKSILVYLPTKNVAARLTNISGEIALKNQGHLIGFHVIPAIPVYGAMSVEIPVDIIEKQEDVFKEQSEETRIEFEKVRSNLGIQAEWRCLESGYGDDAATTLVQARSTDLIVIDQGAENDNFDSRGLPARLVLQSGRPVLIIPSYGDFSDIGKNVLVAWNNSRESARACFDALSLMKNAEEVKILTINQGSDSEQKSFSPADDLAASLSRHNIKVEIHTITNTTIPVSDEILSRAADFGSDLLVMGCYGHSRLHETVFGGVTRGILKSMSIPVLMSH